ncbi:hypothetical protein G9A89_011922 [Geosiphon pyriformis]|nr:hypothetical protein G9A89_011922 [Geosiphon pyriformis]
MTIENSPARFVTRLKESPEDVYITVKENVSDLWNLLYRNLGWLLWRLFYCCFILKKALYLQEPAEDDYSLTSFSREEVVCLLLSVYLSWRCFMQYQDYKLFLRHNAEEPPRGSNHMYLADVEPEEAPEWADHPLGCLFYPIYRILFTRPQTSHKVWTLRIWKPERITLRCFCWFSPVQIFMYHIMTPGKAPFLAIAIIMMAFLLRRLVDWFDDLVKDRQVIYEQMQLEYHEKFVSPRLFRQQRIDTAQTDASYWDLAAQQAIQKSIMNQSSATVTVVPDLPNEAKFKNPEFTLESRSTTESAPNASVAQPTLPFILEKNSPGLAPKTRTPRTSRSAAATSSSPTSKSRKSANNSIKNTTEEYECPADKPSPYKTKENIFQRGYPGAINGVPIDNSKLTIRRKKKINLILERNCAILRMKPQQKSHPSIASVLNSNTQSISIGKIGKIARKRLRRKELNLNRKITPFTNAKQEDEWRKFSYHDPPPPSSNSTALTATQKRKRVEAEDEGEGKQKAKKNDIKGSKKNKTINTHAINREPDLRTTDKDSKDEISESPIDDFQWSEVHCPDGFLMGDDEIGGFLCLEECDGVDIEYEGTEKTGRVIKFKKVRDVNKTGKSTMKAAQPEKPLSLEETRNFYDLDTFDERLLTVSNELVSNQKDKSDSEDSWETVDTFGESTDNELDCGSEDALDIEQDSEETSPTMVAKNTKKSLKNTATVAKTKTSSSSNQTNKKGFTNNFDIDFDISEWKKFKLCPVILNALKSLKFGQPTPIQEKTLPYGLKGRDVIGAAETGSGKTLAFGIPILQYIINIKESSVGSKKNLENQHTNELAALIITPTRELAIQVKDHLLQIGKYAGIKVLTLVGGMAVQKQKRLMDKLPNIIVATPGRLWEMVSENDDYLDRLRRVKFFVLDEADRMLETGHFKELDQIITLLSNTKTNTDNWNNDINTKYPTENIKDLAVRQTFVFSATLDKNLKEDLKRRKFFKAAKPKILDSKRVTMEALMKRLDFKDHDPVFVDITPEDVVAASLQESKIQCWVKDKDIYLYYFITRYPGRTLVFVNSIDAIRRLIPIMKLLGVEVLGLHAQMQQRQRLKNLDRFKQNPKSVMVASDVAARGLDIPSVEHVIHYQLPRSSDIYVHRSGRTARAHREGISLMLCSPEESALYRKICQKLKKDAGMDDFPLDRGIIDAMKQRISLARMIDEEEHKIQKSNHDTDWLQKAAQELEVDLDDEDKSKKKNAAVKGKIKAMKQQLRFLLAQPLVPRGVSTKYLTGGVATVGSVIAVIKKATKVSGSEGGFKIVVLRKKRKSGVLAESINNSGVADKALSNCSWGSEAGNTTESESIDIEKKCLVEETSVNYGENGAFAEEDPDQMPKSLRVKTKKVLGKPLGVIDYGTVDVDNDVLVGSFFLPPSLPIKLSVQVPVCKSFALDIDLMAVAGKSSQEKLNFVKKIFSGVNGFGGASAPSKFGGIILVSFTSEKVMMVAAQLANDRCYGAASSSTSTPQMPRTPSYIDKIKQRNWGDIPITGGYSSLFQNPLFQPKFRTGFENREEESELESEKEISEKTITRPVTGTSSQSRNQETRDQEEEPDIREVTFRNAQGNIIPPPLRPINPPAENGNEITTPYIARLTDFSGEEEETDYFSDPNAVIQLQNEFNTIKQNTGETVTQYLAQFNRIRCQIEVIEQGYYTDPQVLNQFIRGLKSSILGRVCPAHPNSLPEAVMLTRALESAEKEANHSQIVNMVMEENKTETLEKRVTRLGEELSKKIESYLIPDPRKNTYQPPQRRSQEVSDSRNNRSSCQEFKTETRACHFCKCIGHLISQCRT